MGFIQGAPSGRQVGAGDGFITHAFDVHVFETDFREVAVVDATGGVVKSCVKLGSSGGSGRSVGTGGGTIGGPSTGGTGRPTGMMKFSPFAVVIW